MSLHGTIEVNNTRIGAWVARRVFTASPNLYDCEVITDEFGIRETRRFQVEHHYDDGAIALAAKVLSYEATSPPPSATASHDQPSTESENQA